MTTTFIDLTVRDIDERLAAAKDEVERLEAALEALVTDDAQQQPTPRRRVRVRRKQATPPAPQRAMTAKQRQALELIAAKPGMTPAELSRAMGGTYGYHVIKTLASAGEITPCDGGGYERADR